MTPRCAQLIETLQVGGAENLAVQVANALASRGFASHLFVVEDPGPLAERVDPAVDLRFLGFHRASIVNPPHFALSLRRGLGLIERTLREHRIDVVQTHLPGANFWGLGLALRRRAAVVATVHNNQEFCYGDADDPVRGWLRRRAYRAILGRCDATVAVSEKVADSLLHNLGLPESMRPRVRVVPNGVTVPEPMPEARRVELRRRHSVPEGSALLVAAGRHGEQKNFRTLLDAAELLARRDEAFRLVIAGEGPLLAGHRERVAAAGLDDRVELPGNLMDLTDLLQAADVFVLPSLWEGLPLVLLEAMAAGTAVVGSAIPGITEVVSEGEDGLLAPPGDATALADRLSTLLHDAARCNAMGRAAAATVRARHDFSAVVDRLDALYREVIAAPRPNSAPEKVDS